MTTDSSSSSTLWKLIHGGVFILSLLVTMFHIASLVMMGLLMSESQFMIYEILIAMIFTTCSLLVTTGLSFLTLFKFISKMNECLHADPKDAKISDNAKFGYLVSYIAFSGVAMGLCLFQSCFFGMYERSLPSAVYFIQCGLAASVSGCLASLLCLMDAGLKFKFFFKAIMANNMIPSGAMERLIQQ
ncbi:hypothetical protein FDP41_012436 [Naegleria fowleri]|uniref:Uncharacterized protein n=1 Tax=Naegleria fowleri TaxID=5763 RepID=A0A6A5C920_NAEFO|nr:uncharacterized protein FDP41_012436 [Naegleria fowleri]KAF0981779.1 hypothetical protein FDP41_012436 [Naegleria fowleri]CAG4710524.1 unnamed protein product [Naegleria fowleri]